MSEELQPSNFENEKQYLDRALGIEIPNHKCRLNSLGKLIELNLYDKQLIDISVLSNLTSLTTLNLSKNQLSDISILSKLTSLTTLNLSSNQLSDISILSGLASLTTLNLSSNRLKDISVISNLTTLKTLNLSSNRLKDISVLSNLTSLKILNLSFNQLKNIDALSNLSNLTRLSLSRNQLRDIKPLSNLVLLRDLYLGDNDIINIEPLSKITSLIILNIHRNQISDISVLSNLTSLAQLNISDNQIYEINALSNLTSLNYIDAPNNKIEDISVLGNLKFLDSLYIDGNPCTKDENLDTGKNHIDFLRLWLEKNRLQDKIAVLIPKKVVFLGNHASGKSSLLYYLRKNKYAQQTSTTHVLNVAQHNLSSNEATFLKTLFGNKYDGKNILPIMCYDFGGQDFYHGLYQSFSSKTAFQVVVYCANQTEISLEKDSKNYYTYKYPLSFWLKEKEYLEQGAKNPYFIIENKIDAKKEYAFTKDYPNVSDFEAPNGIFHVFLKKLIKINTIKESYNELQLDFLKKQLLQELYEQQEVSQKVINFYKKIYKESIQEKLSIKNKATYKIEGISADNMLTQLQLLENSGVLFLSQDKTKVIANPKAFIEYIHKTILEQKTIFEKKGKLSFDDWEAIDKGQHANLIEAFMKKQKTMFVDADAKEYVFPNYLPLYSQDEERYFLTVATEYLAFSIQLQYFIPFGFINVLIHHFGKEPNKKKFWRDAIYFIQHEDGKPKANVFISVNIQKLRLDVSVETRDATFDLQKYKRYLWLCLSQMYHQEKLISWHELKTKKKDNKSKDYNGEHITEKESLIHKKFPETTKISVEGNYYVSLSYLEKRIENNEYNICVINEEHRSKLVPLHKFQLFTDKTIKKMKKIFISYSNEDIHYKKELEKFLKPMEKFQLAKSWSCEEITPGLWDDQIQNELESSDIVIFMMSMNFASSDYILKDEVYKTFEQMASHKDKKIICVLVKQFPWSYFSSLKDIFYLKDVDLSDADKASFALANLPTNQFIPYYTDTSSKNKDDHKRALKPLNQWEFQEEAFTQIIETLSKIV